MIYTEIYLHFAIKSEIPTRIFHANLYGGGARVDEGNACTVWATKDILHGKVISSYEFCRRISRTCGIQDISVFSAVADHMEYRRALIEA